MSVWPRKVWSRLPFARRGAQASVDVAPKKALARSVFGAGWLLQALAGAQPLDVVVRCAELDEEESAEVEARLWVEAELQAHSGQLQLSCPEGEARGSLSEGSRLRRRRRPLLARPPKDILIALGLELLRSPTEEERPTRSFPDPESAPGAAPAAERVAPAAVEGGPSPSSLWFQSTSNAWALDVGLTYESLGRGSLGALGVEVGGAKYLDAPLALRGFVGGGVGLQVAEELQLGTFASGLLLEVRPLAWLTVGVGPLLSVMRFSGPRGFISERPVSTQGGGQLEIVVAPFGLRSGATVGLRGRLYGRERLVRIDQVEALQVPAWTISLAAGYRFFAETPEEIGGPRRTP